GAATSGPFHLRDAEAMEQLEDVRTKWLAAAVEAGSPEALDRVRVEALGKKGEITQLLKGLAGLGADARREAGQRLNAVKESVAQAIEARKVALDELALDARLAGE